MVQELAYNHRSGGRTVVEEHCGYAGRSIMIICIDIVAKDDTTGCSIGELGEL